MSVATTARSAVSAARRTARRGAGTLLGSAVELRTDAPDVVLTFDDGPEPGGTDRVLEALAGAGASATFFVLLTRVRKYPGLLDEVLAAGHEVALHGVDHRALPTLPPEEVARLVRDGKAELEDAVGREVRWYRPPYGRQTMRNWRAVTAAGMLPVLWGPTTWDWKSDVSDSERVSRAMQGVAAGKIVLAHDGFAGPEDGACDGPPPELDRGRLISAVLDGYAAQGLRARSLGDALDEGRLVRETWFPG
ncbi:polysaccharide deacetylase family protein [Blastococcus sp. LR1]|uniref:polysaccharide deacetylase family protein n=1 Tax=Blastococcus sp. LR1 TaxID=2877000 RepID=UPI001CCD53FB|nr:polysaccharide deacetylase family protein [Blastococcus sp. LR1]MCA0144560.1 polysaccharide deacetylase family protein [Blastococcus sp. LR1]